ncbi:unnamed protein product [Prunus armeniaca]
MSQGDVPRYVGAEGEGMPKATQSLHVARQCARSFLEGGWVRAFGKNEARRNSLGLQACCRALGLLEFWHNLELGFDKESGVAIRGAGPLEGSIWLGFYALARRECRSARFVKEKIIEHLSMFSTIVDR